MFEKSFCPRAHKQFNVKPLFQRNSKSVQGQFIRERTAVHLEQLRHTFAQVLRGCQLLLYLKIALEKNLECSSQLTRLNVELSKLLINQHRETLISTYEKLVLGTAQRQEEVVASYAKNLDALDAEGMRRWLAIQAARHEASVQTCQYSTPKQMAQGLFESAQKYSAAINNFRVYQKALKSSPPSPTISPPQLLSPSGFSPDGAFPTQQTPPLEWTVIDIVGPCTQSALPNEYPSCHSKNYGGDPATCASDIQKNSGNEVVSESRTSKSPDLKKVIDTPIQADWSGKAKEPPADNLGDISLVTKNLRSRSILVSAFQSQKPHGKETGGHRKGLKANDRSHSVSPRQALLLSQKRRRMSTTCDFETQIPTEDVESTKTKELGSLSQLFQQLDDQLAGVMNVVSDEPDLTSESTVATTADFTRISSTEGLSLGSSSQCGGPLTSTSKVKKEPLISCSSEKKPKRGSLKSKSPKAYTSSQFSETCPETMEFLLEHLGILSDPILRHSLYCELGDERNGKFHTASSVAEQVTGTPISSENFKCPQSHEAVASGVPFAMPLCLSEPREFEDDLMVSDPDYMGSNDENIPITFGIRKGRGPLTPESPDQPAPVQGADSAVINYVHDCLAKSSGIFTMKSKIYQTRLKAHLPEPANDSQQRYILSITKPPLIPVNPVELRVIKQLRALDDTTTPHKHVQNSNYRVADLLDDFLTSIVNKMMFLLVIEHRTWYIHAPAREQLTSHLLQFIWPSRPIIQNNFRTFFLNFVEVRIRHFRDSVARHFREKAKHREPANSLDDDYSTPTSLRRSTRSKSTADRKKSSAQDPRYSQRD